MARDQLRRRGRPPVDEAMKQIAIRLPAELLDYVDGELSGRFDGMDRSTFIRLLLHLGRQAHERDKRAKR